ncbi:MAG: cytochrome c oxidase assembly protein, partial [Casimicrobiaceae bacterium]
MVSPALAHGAASIPRTWFADPGVVLILLGFVALYVRGLRALGRTGRNRIAGPWRRAALFCGIALCVAALESPLDELADRLFSVHMLQHVLLTVVIAPLLILGRFDAVMLHALPPGWVAKTGKCLAPLRSAAMWIARPWAVWAIATATIAFWHLPRMYAWAERSPPVHAFEHLMLVVTACAFWWWVVDPRARRHFGLGAAILYLLSFSVVNGFIGAM